MSLKFLTAGESHGIELNTIIEGLPSGLELLAEDINKHLARRQKGYGRGDRMKIETDKAEIKSGVRHGYTLGSPVALTIKNKDWQNWTTVMSAEKYDQSNEEIYKQIVNKQIEHVRPGHADLAGAIKYKQRDVRNILERSSARETATRVSVGAVCLKFLYEFGIDIFSHVIKISSIEFTMNSGFPEDLVAAKRLANQSQLSCIDKTTEDLMISEIDKAKETGDTLGGKIQIIATNLPVGLGSHVHWDRKLDGQIAQAIMSIPAIKAVEIGMGTLVAETPGSRVHDEIFPGKENTRFHRNTNNAGGLEGGITNGSPIIIQATMKPIPTMKTPLQSINIMTGEQHIAHYERSDVCAVPAAGVVCEAMLAFVLARAFLNKFGGDSMSEINSNYNHYINSFL